jgi:cytochrome c biogenesis protein CcdA
LNSAFDTINAYFVRWMKEPHILELALQIILGILLFYFGIRPAKARQSKGDRGVGESVTPLQAFTVAAGLTIVGIPGAIPYLAAIDQILRADLSYTGSLMALLYYNIVFITPLAALVFIRALFPKQSDRILAAISRFMDKWLAHIIKVFLVLLGAAMIVDGVFWLLGRPLIEV